jgi:hypothetical protein
MDGLRSLVALDGVVGKELDDFVRTTAESKSELVESIDS